eukprot:g71564.t1
MNRDAAFRSYVLLKFMPPRALEKMRVISAGRALNTTQLILVPDGQNTISCRLVILENQTVVMLDTSTKAVSDSFLLQKSLSSRKYQTVSTEKSSSSHH